MDNEEKEELEQRECSLCERPGRVYAVEKVPGGGTLFECVHDDGKICEWSAFEDLNSVRRIKADRSISPEVVCPKCGSKGVVKTELDDINRPDRYSYRISHPDGSRCRVSPEHRDIILKVLGRYIESAQKEQSLEQKPIIKKDRKWNPRTQMRCPKCNEIGSDGSGYSTKTLQVIHHHGYGKQTHCVMDKPKLKRIFIANLGDARERDKYKREVEKYRAFIRSHGNNCMNVLKEGTLS